jgi:hypothetical protein
MILDTWLVCAPCRASPTVEILKLSCTCLVKSSPIEESLAVSRLVLGVAADPKVPEEAKEFALVKNRLLWLEL